MQTSRGGFTRWLTVGCVLLALMSTGTSAQVSPDSTALVAMYDALGGDFWNDNTNWKSANPISSWYGVGVNGSNRVESLHLFNNNLNGTLPLEFWTLIELKNMVLHDNQLNAPIDAAVGNMTLLEEMRMWNVGFTGAIPVELGSIASLQELLLGQNQLTGGIPIELGNLTNLHNLGLFQNQLTGNIPTELGNLSSVNLEILDVSDNQLNGSIPSSIGNLTGLTTLWLKANGLSGSIPTELGNLVSLETLHLEETGISGSIPASIVNLVQLQELHLRTNDLSGAIPTGITGLSQLRELVLGENMLTGSIPAGIGSLTNLERFEVGSNAMSGAIPTGLWTLTNMQQLDLWGNSFTGQFPASIAAMTQLRNLTVQRNLMDGTLPSDLGSLSNLEIFFAEGNAFAGSIPASIGSLTNLQSLQLHENQLTGSIPVGLGNTQLYQLDLGVNLLTGSIPADIGTLPNLTWISLRNNQLTGAIPTSLGSLNGITDLNLEINQLSGPIPIELYGLTSIRNLGLYDNQLTGAIDPAIGNLTQVENLTLNNNQLTGPIPATIANLASVLDLSLGNNQLTGPIPAGIGNLSTVQHLMLDNNDLSGQIPSTIENLTNLEQVRMWGNSLTGALPDLSASPNLRVYDFGGNQLTGEIPASIWNMPALEEISLWDNQLTGSLPGAIQNLSTSLQNIGISGNQLSGAIPPEITSLTNVFDFWLGWNEFDSMPDVSSLSPNNFGVEGNMLQFGDLEPNVGVGGISYDPQDEVGTPETIDLNAGENTTLMANVSGSANSYQWYQDGNPISGAVNSDLTLNNVSGADNGDYYAQVTSGIVGGLTLQTATKTVTVLSDLTITVHDTVEAAGNQILVPVLIGDPTGFDVVSLELKIAYDPAIALPGSPDATDVAGGPVENWSIAENIIPGAGIDTLLVAASTANQPLTTAGVLLSLIFDIQAVGVPNTSPVQLVEVLFNDGTPGSITTDGSIEIVVPVPVGSTGPVVVSLVDQESGATPVEVSFENVTNTGDATMISVNQPSNPAPEGFQFSGNIFFDLSPSGGLAFSDSVTVCYDYTGETVGDENALRLLHYEGSAWADVTSSLDTGTNILCGRVDSFSEFGAGEASGTDGVVDTDPDQIQPGAYVSVTVTDVDEDKDDQTVEFITVSAYDVDNADSQQVVLQETGISTGIFTGSLATVYANGGTTVGDGTLGVVVGDTVYVAYTDSLNAASGTDVKIAFSEVLGGDDGSLVSTFIVQALDSRNGVRDTVRVQVSDADGNTLSGTAENLNATVTNSRSGEVETLALLETGDDTGVFRLRVPTVTTAPVNDDGELSIDPDDTLFVSYDDQITSVGNAATLSDTVQVVNLFGDVRSNDKVQAFDAAFILASAVGLNSPSGRDSLIMDVDGDADVLASDASDVLQYVVRLINRFDVQTDSSFLAGVDSLRNHPFLKPALFNRMIVMGDLVKQEGTYLIPVNLGEREGVTSATLEIGHDPSVQVVDVFAADGFGSYMVAHNARESSVRAAIAGSPTHLKGSGAILWIEVRPTEDGPIELSLDWVALNGDILTHVVAPEVQTFLDESVSDPDRFELHQNIPNPFNPQTTIRFDVPEASAVRIVVYSVLGQEVATLLSEQRDVGRHQVVWTGQDAYGRSVGSGVYFVRMDAGAFSQIRRMMFLK
jgi:Leucine-rich repeat (LRR) protein